MKTKEEIIQWLIDHQSDFIDLAIQDIWIIFDEIITFYETEPNLERKELVMNNIRSLLKGMIYA